jgi:hypothetical protein
MPGIWMSHASHLITIPFIQNPDIEHPVVDNQKEHRPFYEWPIKAFNSFLDKCCLVIQIFEREEITCCNEEKRHVELKDEFA